MSDELSHEEPTGPWSGFAAGVDDLAVRLSRVEVEDAIKEQEAVDEAQRVLHLGLGLIGEPEPIEGELLPRGVSGRVAAPLTTMPITSSMLLSRDTAARRAFVLGGPEAVGGSGRR
jgi:hypothetical protein